MGTFKDDMHRIADKLGIELHPLDQDRSYEVWCTLARRFSDGDCRRRWLWEGACENSFSYVDPDGGGKVGEFVGDRSCIIISRDNPDLRSTGFAVRDGSELTRLVYDDIPLDEFCITDAECSYMITYNHHWFLCGYGDAAKSWVMEKARELEQDDANH